MVMHQFTNCSVSFHFQIFRAFFLNFQEFFFEFFKKINFGNQLSKTNPDILPTYFLKY
jgi:hypothetical protein